MSRNTLPLSEQLSYRGKVFLALAVGMFTLCLAILGPSTQIAAIIVLLLLLLIMAAHGIWKKPQTWISVLVVSSFLSLPTFLKVSLGNGLINVRIGMIGLVLALLWVLTRWTGRPQKWYARHGGGLILMGLGFLLSSTLRYMGVGYRGTEMSLGGDITQFQGHLPYLGNLALKGVSSSVLLISYVVTYLVLQNLIAHDRRRLSIALQSFIGASAFYCFVLVLAIGISVLRFGSDIARWIIGIRGLEYWRYVSLLEPRLTLGPAEGTLFAVGSVMALACAISPTLKAQTKVTYFALGVILLVGTVLSLSRGAWITLLLGWSALLVIGVYKRILRMQHIVAMIATIGFMFLIGGLISSLVPGLVSSLGLASRIQRSLDISTGTGLARIESARRQFEAFLGRPILGNGAETYKLLTEGLPAENLLVEILYSAGLLGFVPFVISIAGVLLHALRAIRRLTLSRDYQLNPWIIPTFLGSISFIVGVQTNSSGWFPQFWILLALLAAALSQADSNGFNA